MCMLLKLYTLSENDRVYSGLSHHEILTIKISKNANSAEIKENPSTSNPYISKIVCQSIINNTIFWKHVTRPFRCMYINCFNRLILLLQSAQICKKMHFFDNFRTITLEGNMKTRQMTPFFSSAFPTLAVCNIHFWIWKGCCVSQPSALRPCP